MIWSERKNKPLLFSIEQFTLCWPVLCDQTHMNPFLNCSLQKYHIFLISVSPNKIQENMDMFILAFFQLRKFPCKEVSVFFASIKNFNNMHMYCLENTCRAQQDVFPKMHNKSKSAVYTIR